MEQHQRLSARRSMEAQEQSAFFSQLPAELRLQIYRHAYLHNKRIHIRRRLGFLVNIPCQGDHVWSGEPAPELRYARFTTDHRLCKWWAVKASPDITVPMASFLAMMLACRRM